MGVKDPGDKHRLFADAFNAYDLLVALYEPEAVLVPQARQRAIGRDAIREALAGFLAGFGTIELTARGGRPAARHRAAIPEFRLHGTGEDGDPVTQQDGGRAASSLRPVAVC